MRGLLKKIDKTVIGHRVLGDPVFRLFVTANMSMGWNAIYAIFNGIMGIVYHSFWFASMFAYYAVLSVMRFLVISSKRKKQKKSEMRLMKIIGIGMMILAIVLSGVVCMGIAENHNPRYNIIVMITIAAYTFYIVIQTIISVVKAHKKKDINVIMLRDISLVSSAGAILSLERSMLGTFGDAKDLFSMTMTIISGACSFLFVIAVGVSMMVRAGRDNDEKTIDVK